MSKETVYVIDENLFMAIKGLALVADKLFVGYGNEELAAIEKDAADAFRWLTTDVAKLVMHTADVEQRDR